MNISDIDLTLAAVPQLCLHLHANDSQGFCCLLVRFFFCGVGQSRTAQCAETATPFVVGYTWDKQPPLHDFRLVHPAVSCVHFVPLGSIPHQLLFTASLWYVVIVRIRRIGYRVWSSLWSVLVSALWCFRESIEWSGKAFGCDRRINHHRHHHHLLSPESTISNIINTCSICILRPCTTVSNTTYDNYYCEHIRISVSVQHDRPDLMAAVLLSVTSWEVPHRCLSNGYVLRSLQSSRRVIICMHREEHEN